MTGLVSVAWIGVCGGGIELTASQQDGEMLGLSPLVLASEAAVAIATLTAKNARLQAEVDAMRAERDAAAAAEAIDWSDRPDDMTAAIKASHPVNSGDHKTYVRAMELVGNRYSKGALVMLVHHLLRLATQEKPHGDQD